MSLTKKEVASRWECSTKTVERRVRTFKLRPVKFIGLQPLFSVADVDFVLLKLNRNRAKQRGYTLKGGAR